MENRGRDVSSLLVAAAPYVPEYDLVFFLHDKKVTQLEPRSVGNSWQKKCFENLIPNETFIENVIDTFDKEPCLGMMFPPGPYRAFPDGAWGQLVDGEWQDSFVAADKVLKDFKISVGYSNQKQPIAPLGTMFVFRPDSLQLLLDGIKGEGWKYDDFPEEPIRNDGTILHGVERAYPYFVQQAGYYASWLLNDHWYRIELDNFYYSWRIWEDSYRTNLRSVDGILAVTGAKRWLQKQINNPKTQARGLWLWKTYRRIFPKR
jgi:rhamnosyltransferase